MHTCSSELYKFGLTQIAFDEKHSFVRRLLAFKLHIERKKDLTWSTQRSLRDIEYSSGIVNSKLDAECGGCGWEEMTIECKYAAEYFL